MWRVRFLNGPSWMHPPPVPVAPRRAASSLLIRSASLAKSAWLRPLKVSGRLSRWGRGWLRRWAMSSCFPLPPKPETGSKMGEFVQLPPLSGVSLFQFQSVFG